MYEYTIRNKKTNQQEVIFGHSYAGAFKKWGLNPDEWIVEFVNYDD